jgi:hypothetical protein
MVRDGQNGSGLTLPSRLRKKRLSIAELSRGVASVSPRLAHTEPGVL